jgi:primosomal protein N' (replication factor Y)
MKKELFADIILPLAVKGKFTYRVPENLAHEIVKGTRVIVRFGDKKLYSAVVCNLSDRDPGLDNIKEISDLLDTTPLINEIQLKFWKWISEYYMCSEGEVMKAAMPSGLCLQSETVVSINPDASYVRPPDNPSALLMDLIENRQPVSLRQLPSTVGNKSAIKLINDLVKRNAIVVGQTISEKYRPREGKFLVLSRKYTDKELNHILDSFSGAPKQLNVLSTYLRLTSYSPGADLFPVKGTVLIKESGALPSSLAALVKKGIFVSLSLEITRISQNETSPELLRELSPSQAEAFSSVKMQLKEKEILLLHGVTSSGKTELYIRLIDEQLKKGKQILYLLPEIALTTQIVSRLRRHFGRLTTVFHSRLTDAERIEIWKSVANIENKNGIRLVIGARSSLFLPFHDLGLVIVDEEHDSSYKQQDPAPRYHARDSAIMMASLWKVKTILGSATPSVETFYNSSSGKYGYVWMGERYGKVNLPQIIIANTREAYRKKLMVSHFSPQLLHMIDEALADGEQVMLFRNRRGFSPYIECSECGWIPTCSRCAVNLTYHKETNRLVCHYCGSAYQVPSRCESCGNISLVTRGFGTEKLEDEIKIVFPEARVARMDQDSTRNKNSFGKIISSFESRQTDILIGTQMISKGLDFENLTVVGILNADGMLNYPDFRAHERAFQMMSQVSGRAGRRQKHGRVIIQTSDPENRVIRQVLNNDFMGMYESQLEERKMFNYPPFCRLIRIILKHKDRSKLNELASILGDDLKKTFGTRVLGPEFPSVSRIQLWYIKNILLKIEKDKPFAKARFLIGEAIDRVEKFKGAASLRINVDVDPY